MPQNQPPDPWSYRASDADRDKFLSLLREAYAEGRLDAAEYEERMAVALAAKTYGDLMPVIADLPFDGARLPGLPTAAPYPAPASGQHLPPAVPVPPPAFATDTSLVAVFGSTSRGGVWQVPQSLVAFALFGEVKIDLTNAVLPGLVTELRCTAILGSVEVIVPDAVHVEVNGVGVFGAFDRVDKRRGANKQRVPVAGAPLVRITGLAVFGGVEARVVMPKSGHAGVRVMGQPLPPPPAYPQIDGPGEPAPPPQ